MTEIVNLPSCYYSIASLDKDFLDRILYDEVANMFFDSPEFTVVNTIIQEVFDKTACYITDLIYERYDIELQYDYYINSLDSHLYIRHISFDENYEVDFGLSIDENIKKIYEWCIYRNYEGYFTLLFHIGRGGRHYNPGHLTFEGFEKLGYIYGKYDLFLAYENAELQNKILNKNECTVEDISEEMFEDIEESFNDLGELHITDGSGSNVIDIESYKSEEGVLNIDGEYNTWYTKRGSELTENEYNTFIDQASVEDIQSFFYKYYEYPELIKLIMKFDLYKGMWSENKLLQFDIKDLLASSDIVEYDTMKAVLDDGINECDVIDLYDKFYCKKQKE